MVKFLDYIMLHKCHDKRHINNQWGSSIILIAAGIDTATQTRQFGKTTHFSFGILLINETAEV